MRLARTAIESVTVGIQSDPPQATPPDVSVGLGTASPGRDAQWVTTAWTESGVGTEAVLQIAGVEAPETSALRMAGFGHNYLYVRFGTVIRKAPVAVEVR